MNSILLILFIRTELQPVFEPSQLVIVNERRERERADYRKQFISERVPADKANLQKGDSNSGSDRDLSTAVSVLSSK